MDESARQQATAAMHASVPFLGRMGLEVVELAPRHCILRAPFDRNGNHFGAMYAGALYTLAEVPGGMLFNTSFDTARYFPLVKGSQIRFRRAARTDITVEARMDADEVVRLSAEADEHGKADYDLTVELRDTDGEVVAEMTSTYQLRTHGSLT